MTKNLKKQLFPKEYAKELLRIADGDVASAIGLSQLTNGRPENIVFLAQQAIEKYIKAVLVHLEIAFPLLHDLGVLVALLPDDKMPVEGFELMELNPFASVRRYHEGDVPLTKQEIEASLKVAQNISNWAKAIASL
ncbi:MAG: HEPN domain-containing protein [Bdellovibrionaceae bacterium]|nr:HEPN domain-containing protein [Pseudobdellovibrionaceae bacterium]